VSLDLMRTIGVAWERRVELVPRIAP
jgi:hypothetical protein